ncbi:poly(A)+ RNA export protein [Rhizoctonia solani]|uniref:Poly(A)+ RNA export protein n=1 Tax=Rhizoctonia solani TaxID=456999 RepID=A0A8H8P4Q6_9AGAM|nr:poly(A)+ RNA export protein [Rhizoctonia solani]QRW25210.1 poly(A)+ RNA export protein [Rhizoctonia solani]
MARPKSSTKAAAASTETKKATTSKPRASATKAAATEKVEKAEKATTKKTAPRTSKGAASKAAAEPKKAPTRGRKRAPDDEPASSAPAKPTKKAKADTAAETAAEETAAEETAAEEEATKEKEETAQESTQPEPETEAPKPKVNGVKKTDSLLSNSSRRRGQPPKPKPAGTTLNSVPAIPEHPRPAYQILVFGNGDSSQFGMGPNATGEYPRPRMQKFFKTASDEGKLGGEGAGVESLAAGGLHTLAIDEAGKVWTWGTNDDGALGRLVEGPDPEDPSKTIDSDVAESTPTVLNTLAEEQFRAVSVAAGNNVSLALGTNGQLRAWGSFRSNEGAFGFDGRPGSARIQYLPTTLEALTKDVFVQIACGGDHCLALTETGHVYVWGTGEQFQLGRKVLERHKKRGLFPEKLHLRNIVSIGCGAYHSFAIDKKGVVYAWGLNVKRQCGIPGEEDQILQPTPIPALHPDVLGHDARVVQASGGNHHSVFVTSDGRVYACGTLTDSQLGIGDDHPAIVNPDDEEEAKFAMSEPVLVPFPPPPTADKLDPDVGPYAEASVYPPRTPIVRVSVGTDYTLAVSKSGHVYSWGDGQSCELGLTKEEDDEESVVQQKTPKRIVWKNVDNWFVQDASAGGQHCMLLVKKIEE